ncbi:16S rRNA (cytidine(1402)-2'-O)-methyltransferase [Candidatus Kaiserbacteria bacterium RIFCSPLOWO2_12_FULL_52_8]|uniref:Ribosomal RNA small subunit methyltransferase I n=1 Tax=Candidatus Kaiserbacteria bacterium RIFCSPHIGHO2_01_FULL_53_31 TaxID=1798481 RepID=A0A1F6CG74_9BACT|nr:MAG: 16S rRNA (cytidine(1402)-2'-O)-methyltransferase [Candidatus Kaiserbacteria bacterium RIFCSPHIGHO2_01_FULL_53_31]OGG92949.1 MAG: 16S rRNA (cytidine(1402)-2'-O)-methyltransferase [Candidatus Kaiserbacteria bacterium RIFCSPLOWO2_12_FULL_52_8]
MTNTGTLSIVATPIGNLEDITLRALRTLKECDVIYAEDTRIISKLLARYQIKKPLQRLDAATEMQKADEIIARLEAGEHVAYVSDAGTPGISDPGARMVRAVREHSHILKNVGITIEAIPGPSALTTALSIAGLDTTGFTFLGFLPHKKGRQTALKKLASSDIPVVLYESPHRIIKLLDELEALRISSVTIARELTKIHEEVTSGTVGDVQAYFKAHPDHVRGEFVVIIEP